MKASRQYSKNREQLISSMLDKYGYIFCERCGRSKAFKFEVHHIIFRSEKPKHPNIHDIENLLIVCNDCHKYFHDNKDARNKLVKKRKLNLKFN